jgi:hypothetical protein
VSGAPETRYTDRDVRENADLIDRAYAYVEAYTGEFQYLIDMKMRIASGSTLTTPMVKGVLNCMRADPRVTDLPQPLPVEEAVVVEMRPKREKRKRYVGRIECPQVAAQIEHGYHTYETVHETGSCEGFHFINREYEVDMKVVIKRPFVKARGGRMIHLVGDMNRCAIRWFANQHSWGFCLDWKEEFPRLDLLVKTACKYPSYLRNPLLMDEAIAEFFLFPVAGEDQLTEWCPHCQEVMRV